MINKNTLKLADSQRFDDILQINNKFSFPFNVYVDCETFRVHKWFISTLLSTYHRQEKTFYKKLKLKCWLLLCLFRVRVIAFVGEISNKSTPSLILQNYLVAEKKRFIVIPLNFELCFSYFFNITFMNDFVTWINWSGNLKWLAINYRFDLWQSSFWFISPQALLWSWNSTLARKRNIYRPDYSNRWLLQSNSHRRFNPSSTPNPLNSVFTCFHFTRSLAFEETNERLFKVNPHLDSIPCKLNFNFILRANKCVVNFHSYIKSP